MMLRKRVISIVFILGWAAQVSAGDVFSATVKKVIDGDSLLVSTDRGDIEVRLYGVDIPEYDQPFSRQAKIFTQKAVLGKKVMIEPVAEDAYGRTVAVVAKGADIINRELVQAGLAWVYPRYCKKAVCTSWKKDERTARDEKMGLWQETQPNPPWQWKKSKRNR